MNTTALIARWSMHGAGRDFAGHFRTTDDIRALLGAEPEPGSAPPVESLLVKPAGKDDWLLLADAE